MKKAILLAFTFLFAFVLGACTKEIPDYSIEEAWGLMNEAIQTYRDADSLSLTYSGSYTGANYSNTETMSLLMKRMNSDGLISQVVMNVTENDQPLYSKVDYVDGVSYSQQTYNDKTDYIKQTMEWAVFQDFYTSFLKSTIEYSKVKHVQILVDTETLTVNFELPAGLVESTFFVSNMLDQVGAATVSVQLDHNANLMFFSVDYDAIINEVTGHESYQVRILKMNQYIVIHQLTEAKKATYEEASTDGS